MSKLHPIYVAMDSHQYSKAIKLAAALPESNILGKALLANAYARSGQRYLAISSLKQILGPFAELQNEMELSKSEPPKEKLGHQMLTTTSTTKKGKKGKKKPVAHAIPTPITTFQEYSSLSDKIDGHPSLPEGWETIDSLDNPIVDETTLETLSVTLQHLKLTLTAFQVYLCACKNAVPGSVLTTTFMLGLRVLASPLIWDEATKMKVTSYVLSNMQATALQFARLVAAQSPSSMFDTMLASAWASQCALWQLQWLPHDHMRSSVLPRLAESMARRVLQQEGERAPSAEASLLCLRTLEYQNKWDEILEFLKSIDARIKMSQEGEESLAVSDMGVSLTINQVQSELAKAFLKLGQYENAKATYEQLLFLNPDNWTYWKEHLHTCVKLEDVTLTRDFSARLLAENCDSKYPIRSIHLIQLELEAHSVRCEPTQSTLRSLATLIKTYATKFASRIPCAFSDIEAYLDLLLDTQCESLKHLVVNLLTFSAQLRKENVTTRNNTEFSDERMLHNLRGFIFAIKLNHKLLMAFDELKEQFAVDPVEMILQWKHSLRLLSTIDKSESQRETRPGDELVLLAVSQLVCETREDHRIKLACAALLEQGIRESPDNAYMKIALIDIYFSLNAMPLAWQKYKSIGLKHIQLESCSHVILPYLMQGGLFNEAIEVCNSLLRFHAGTSRDCGDYAGRAISSGTLSKAHEFLGFQRAKMCPSMSMLEAKGLILDAAPLIGEVHETDEGLISTHGHLGLYQGIVGTDKDIHRAHQMIAEIHNPNAALSLVSWADRSLRKDEFGDVSDNRDGTLFSFTVMNRRKLTSKAAIIQDSARRGLLHGLLVRATLCVDAAKVPKKGKIVKADADLEKTTKSLLKTSEMVSKFIDDNFSDGSLETERSLLLTIYHLARTLCVVTAGELLESEDSLENREKRAAEIIEQACFKLKDVHAISCIPTGRAATALLSNYIVHVFALFRMCSNISEAYGWGQKQCKNVQFAKAFANLASMLKRFVGDLLSIVESLSIQNSVDDFSSLPEVFREIDPDLFQATTTSVTQAQGETVLRVKPILIVIQQFFGTFEVGEG